MSFLLGCAPFSTWEASCGFSRLENGPSCLACGWTEAPSPLPYVLPFSLLRPPLLPLEKPFKRTGWEGFPLVQRHVFNLSLLSCHFSDQKNPIQEPRPSWHSPFPPSVSLFVHHRPLLCPLISLAHYDGWWQTVCSSLHITYWKNTHSASCEDKNYLYDAFKIKRQQKVCHILWILV